MRAIAFNATNEQMRQGIIDMVDLGHGPTLVEICATLSIDGGWLETLVLDEMLKLQGFGSFGPRQ